MSMNLGLRSRLVPALLGRWLASMPPSKRRGQMSSTSHLRQRNFGVLEVECYVLRVAAAAGVGASIYLHSEEIVRLDCFGETGHYHLNLRQSALLTKGGAMRIAFLADSVAAQAAEAGAVIRRNLRQTMACNWHPAVRAERLTDSEVALIADSVTAELSELLAYRVECSSPAR